MKQQFPRHWAQAAKDSLSLNYRKQEWGKPQDSPSFLGWESCPVLGTGGNLAESSGQKQVRETREAWVHKTQWPKGGRSTLRNTEVCGEAVWSIHRALGPHVSEEATEGCGKNHLEELEQTVNGTDTGWGRVSVLMSQVEKHILIHGPLAEDSQGSGFRSCK